MWDLQGIVVASTESTKWAVRVVPDGAGGFVAAWEENRGRRLCCRDTRDLYAQRIGPDGAKLWGAQDVQIAAEAAGEELLGLAPAAGGGAFVVWRRGGGTLLAQRLDARGAKQDGVDGTSVFAVAETCEWAPGTGSAWDPDGRGGVVAWGYPGPGPGRASVLVSALAASASGWTAGPPLAALAGLGLHPAAVAAGGRGARLVFVWTVTSGGLQFTAVPVGPDGAPAARPVSVGPAQSDARWVHAETAGDGTGGAWVVWAAVKPEAMGKAHPVRVGWVGPATGRAWRAGWANAGEARTLAMFIPPTMVGSGGGEEVPATNELVAWRTTSVIAAAGEKAALMARLRGDQVEVVAVRRAGTSVTVGPARAFGGKAYSGFGPRLVPDGRNGAALIWVEQADPAHWTMVAVRVRARNGSVETDGEPAVVAGPLPEAPRLYDAVVDAGGSLLVAWTAMQAREFGGIRAQRIAWSAPAAK